MNKRWMSQIEWISGFRKGQRETIFLSKFFERGQIRVSEVTNDMYRVLETKENPEWRKNEGTIDYIPDFPFKKGLK